MTPGTLPTAARGDNITYSLRKSRVLANGRVVDVFVESDRVNLMSRILRLRLTYDGVWPEAPRTLILKTRLAKNIDRDWNGAEREVAFYDRVAPMLREGVVPRCFGGQYDPETGDWHLLLEDLTDSHFIVTQWPLPPTRTQCEAILTARARFQAAWWDDPRLGVSVGTWPDTEAIERHIRRLERSLVTVYHLMGEDMPPERRDLFNRFLEAMPRLLARHQTHRNVTIAQGDAHVWNCFLPRDGGNDARLFDWDSWYLSVPTSDLAYMMAVHWYPDRRRRMEQPLLDHYHASLLTHGVTGYDRHSLFEDYRLSVLAQIATPVFQAADQIPPVIWWNNLERILMAVDDLGCRELLG